jgi:hypothetical protein
LSGHNLQDISRDVPPSALRNVMADTPGALWDARFASVLVPGPATPPGRLNLMLPARDGEALIDGCLPVAVMVGEDAR